MKFKVGDLIIRESDKRLAMVVNADRQERGIIRVQYYGVPKEHGYTDWHCDDVAYLWSHQ
tara:strand:- start:421 stop:600 length:180 start_codon:yes stop_codon:yes gene_type:complete